MAKRQTKEHLLEVYGLLNDKTFHKARCCAEDIKKDRPNQFGNPVIKPMLEFEWVIFVREKKLELKGEMWSFNKNVLCCLDGDVIGSDVELLEWAKETYNHDDFRNEIVYDVISFEAYNKFFLDDEKRSFIYMDIDIDMKSQGRILFELDDEKCPKTCANFRYCCKDLFVNSTFHKLVPNGWMQAGALKEDNVPPQLNSLFEDESFANKHDRRGVLGSANNGRHTNGIQFYVTFDETAWMDRAYVAFGKIVEGSRVLKLIEEQPTYNERPTVDIRIADAGRFTGVEPHYTPFVGVRDPIEVTPDSSFDGGECEEEEEEEILPGSQMLAKLGPLGDVDAALDAQQQQEGLPEDLDVLLANRDEEEEEESSDASDKSSELTAVDEFDCGAALEAEEDCKVEESAQDLFAKPKVTEATSQDTGDEPFDEVGVGKNLSEEEAPADEVPEKMASAGDVVEEASVDKFAEEEPLDDEVDMGEIVVEDPELGGDDVIENAPSDGGEERLEEDVTMMADVAEDISIVTENNTEAADEAISVVTVDVVDVAEDISIVTENVTEVAEEGATVVTEDVTEMAGEDIKEEEDVKEVAEEDVKEVADEEIKEEEGGDAV